MSTAARCSVFWFGLASSSLGAILGYRASWRLYFGADFVTSEPQCHLECSSYFVLQWHRHKRTISFFNSFLPGFRSYVTNMANDQQMMDIALEEREIIKPTRCPCIHVISFRRNNAQKSIRKERFSCESSFRSSAGQFRMGGEGAGGSKVRSLE